MFSPGILMGQLSSYMTTHPRQGAMWCLLAGLLMPLAFAPLALFPLALLLPVALFACWLRATPVRAFVYGWSFGLGMFAHGVYWVYHSMHVFGHMPLPLAIFFTLLLASYFALFPALVGWLANRWFPLSDARRLLLVYPVLWTLLEWVRGWLLSGFPWLNLGYSQTDTWLAGLAPWLGVYGLSWLVVLSAGLLVLLVAGLPRVRARAAAGLLGIWLAAAYAGSIEWTEPAGAPFRVSLVQGNIPQSTKWRPQQQRQIIDSYMQQTQPHWKSDLIIWPETAIPAFYHSVEDGFVEALERQARATQTELLIGLPMLAEDREHYYNSMISLGTERGFYFKRHLVPFGEFVPLRDWLQDMLDVLRVPMAAFSPGEMHQPPLRVAGYEAAISICYEIAFGEEVIMSLPQANFLVNVSNNAWFGDSSAPHQQLQMARMRAQESGRYVVSATNDGMTAIVDHQGEVVEVAPQFQAVVLSGTVEPRQGATPYVRTGNYPIIIALWLLLGGMIYLVRKGKAV